MADVSEEAQVIAACSTLLAAAGLGAAAIKRKKRKNSTWIKTYIREREALGVYNALLLELATDEVTICTQ